MCVYVCVQRSSNLFMLALSYTHRQGLTRLAGVSLYSAYVGNEMHEPPF